MADLHWKRVEPTVVSKIGWRTVVSKTFVQPDGKKQVYDTFHAEEANFACSIALTPEHRVVIARQFRPGPERIMAELPGGGVEPGEDPAIAARREQREETGYDGGTLELLGTSSRSAFNNGLWHYYLITGCTLQGSQQLDETEFADVELITIPQLIENAKRDRMTDPHAVLMAYDRLVTLQEA